MNENIELYVPLKNSLFNNVELTPGELRTLAVILSQREDYIIYENKTAEQQNVSIKTMERRFKHLMELGYLRKEFKVDTTPYKKNFDWVITPKGKQYKAVGGQKYYTRFKKKFLLEKNINDFDWLVLSVMLCNTKEYKNYATTIRDELHITTDKRSRLTKSIERLEEKNLIFKNTDTNDKLFYSVNEVAWDYIMKKDRSNYETKEEREHKKNDEILRRVSQRQYERLKEEKEKRILSLSNIYDIDN